VVLRNVPLFLIDLPSQISDNDYVELRKQSLPEEESFKMAKVTNTIDTLVAEEIEISFADLQSDTPPSKKGGKAVNPDSGRQAILQVLYRGGEMSPKMITEMLKASGREVKYIHSHLNYFKAHGQVRHNENGTYDLTQKSIDTVSSYMTKEA
jgi:hypothetical protein